VDLPSFTNVNHPVRPMSSSLVEIGPARRSAMPESAAHCAGVFARSAVIVTRGACWSTLDFIASTESS
jgi:hypothetical protein